MFWSYVTMTFLMLTGVFLMIVVLLQRGRGGGLAGAFGGAGGQSAFGTKAGDVFTKITVIIAVIWVVLAGASGFVLRAGARLHDEPFKKEKEMAAAPETPTAPAKDDLEPEKGKSAESPPAKKVDKQIDQKVPEGPPQKKGEGATKAAEKEDESAAQEKPPAGKEADNKTKTDTGPGPKLPESSKGEGSP